MLKRCLSFLISSTLAMFCAVPALAAFETPSQQVLSSQGESSQPELSQPVSSQANTLGLYLLNSRYTGNVEATRGWSVSWRVPSISNASEAWGAIGQWYFNLESGIYHAPGDGWMVYYFGDDNGTAGNNAGCNLVWGSGGTCSGVMGNLQPNQQLTFTYEWCTATNTPSVNGAYLCLWVDLHDGVGKRFLAADGRSTVEMYAHDIETFTDSGPSYVPPAISCTQPTKMVGQSVKNSSGTWVPMTGNLWSFDDTTPSYEFRNINTTLSPARWESCSTTQSACADPAWNSATIYVNGNIVSHQNRRWRAKWWTQGEEPGTTGQWGVWLDLGPC